MTAPRLAPAYMPLTSEQQVQIRTLAQPVGVPQSIVELLFKDKFLTFAQAKALVSSIQDEQSTEARLLQTLARRVDEGSLEAEIETWLQSVRDYLPQVQNPLVMRILLMANPSEQELSPFYGCIETLEYQRQVGSPALGFLYAGDMLKAAKFWDNLPKDRVIGLFMTISRRYRHNEVLQARACSRNGGLFKLLDKRAQSSLRVAVAAVKSDRKNLAHADEELRQQARFKRQILDSHKGTDPKPRRTLRPRRAVLH